MQICAGSVAEDLCHMDVGIQLYGQQPYSRRILQLFPQPGPYVQLAYYLLSILQLNSCVRTRTYLRYDLASPSTITLHAGWLHGPAGMQMQADQIRSFRGHGSSGSRACSHHTIGHPRFGSCS
jgi:hypothetical protein